MQENIIKAIPGGTFALAAYLFGGFDGMLAALLTFIGIDIFTGLLQAGYNKDVNSRVMFKGGIKKVGIICIVAVANVADNAIGLNGIVRNLTIGYFMANEGLSIIENWGAIGIMCPEKLKEILAQLRDGKENKKS